jgi:hypothetical protein
MLEYWWVILVIACLTAAAGGLLWLYTAIDLTRVVSPSARWVARESRYNVWGIRLMIAGAALAGVALAMAIGHWLAA